MSAACPKDHTPLVSTFEMAGAEYHCLACGSWFGCLSVAQLTFTDEQTRLNDALVARFRAGERGPIEIGEAPPAVAPSDDHIKCDGCGKDSGRTIEQGKPSAWFQRTRKGVTQRACSLDCVDRIPDRGLVLPW